MTVRTAGFLFLLALFSWPATAQTNPAIPKTGETIEVSIVNLDVFVTDKRGNRQTFPFTAKEGAPETKLEYDFSLLTDLLSDKLSVGILDEVSHEQGFAVANLPTAAARQ